jgi:hypothetical protein
MQATTRNICAACIGDALDGLYSSDGWLTHSTRIKVGRSTRTEKRPSAMYRPRGTPALLRQHIALALFLPEWSELGEVGGRRRFYAEKSSHSRQDLSFPAKTFR